MLGHVGVLSRPGRETRAVARRGHRDPPIAGSAETWRIRTAA